MNSAHFCRCATIVALGALQASLTACSPSTSVEAAKPAEPASVASAAFSAGRTHTLTIYGYNYTDRYIDSFDVDGQGGGNLDVSTPDAGGSKSVCCYGWRDGTPLPQTFRVRWSADACMQRVTNSYGESREVVKHSFKERDVVFAGPSPKSPSYLEVHFYPDEHIEIALTSDYSPPRLKLDPDRQVRDYPKCKETP